MFCKNCGQPLNENQAVCLNCGVEVGKGNGFCANCGNAVTPEAAYCLNCGVALKANEENTKTTGSANLGGHDKVTMAVLCFFLGGLGVHNFVMGETKKGVLRLLLSFICGIGGVIALIDFIKILCDTYIVDPDKLLW